MQIVDLVSAPEHHTAVADRIWNAWWQADGFSLADVEAALNGAIAAVGYPSFTLVAVDDGVFTGTVTVIEQDVAERPTLGPWIAALWVEPQARRRGVASSLMEEACARMARSGFTEAFLAAKPGLRAYYDGRGWILRETSVGSDGLDIFVRALP